MQVIGSRSQLQQQKGKQVGQLSQPNHTAACVSFGENSSILCRKSHFEMLNRLGVHINYCQCSFNMK